jgi:hypothetical protein
MTATCSPGRSQACNAHNNHDCIRASATGKQSRLGERGAVFRGDRGEDFEDVGGVFEVRGERRWARSDSADWLELFAEPLAVLAASALVDAPQQDGSGYC